VNDVILGNITEELSQLIEIRIKVGVVDQYSSSVRRSQPAQRIEQRRFPGTAWSEDPDELARLNDQRGILQNQAGTGLAAKAHRDHFAGRHSLDPLEFVSGESEIERA